MILSGHLYITTQSKGQKIIEVLIAMHTGLPCTMSVAFLDTSSKAVRAIHVYIPESSSVVFVIEREKSDCCTKRGSLEKLIS